MKLVFALMSIMAIIACQKNEIVDNGNTEYVVFYEQAVLTDIGIEDEQTDSSAVKTKVENYTKLFLEDKSISTNKLGFIYFFSDSLFGFSADFTPLERDRVKEDGRVKTIQPSSEYHAAQ